MFLGFRIQTLSFVLLILIKAKVVREAQIIKSSLLSFVIQMYLSTKLSKVNSQHSM